VTTNRGEGLIQWVMNLDTPEARAEAVREIAEWADPETVAAIRRQEKQKAIKQAAKWVGIGALIYLGFRAISDDEDPEEVEAWDPLNN